MTKSQVKRRLKGYTLESLEKIGREYLLTVGDEVLNESPYWLKRMSIYQGCWCLGVEEVTVWDKLANTNFSREQLISEDDDFSLGYKG